MLVNTSLFAWWCEWCDHLQEKGDTCLVCGKKRDTRPDNILVRCIELYQYSLVKKPSPILCTQIIKYTEDYIDKFKERGLDDNLLLIFNMQCETAETSMKFKLAGDKWLEFLKYLNTHKRESISNQPFEEYTENLLFRALQAYIKMRDYGISTNDGALVRGGDTRIVRTAEAYEAEYPKGKRIKDALKLHAAILMRNKNYEESNKVLLRILKDYGEDVELSLFTYQALVSNLTEMSEYIQAAKVARDMEEYAFKYQRLKDAKVAADAEFYQYGSLVEDKKPIDDKVILEFISHCEKRGYINLAKKALILLITIYSSNEKDLSLKRDRLEELRNRLGNKYPSILKQINNLLPIIYFNIATRFYEAAKFKKTMNEQIDDYLSAAVEFIKAGDLCTNPAHKTDAIHNAAMSYRNVFELLAGINDLSPNDKKKRDEIYLLAIGLYKGLYKSAAGKNKEVFRVTIERLENLKERLILREQKD